MVALLKATLGVGSEAETKQQATTSYEDKMTRTEEMANVSVPVPIAPVAPSTATVSAAPPQPFRTGRWSLDEKLLFMYGLSKFGKGRWKKISIYVPDRSLVQIKSHAQKVMKRLDAGENVFRRMEENSDRLKMLVAETHERIGGEPTVPKASNKAAKRKRRITKKITEPTPATTTTSWDHVDYSRRQVSAESSPTPSLLSSPPEDPPMLYASQKQLAQSAVDFNTEDPAKAEIAAAALLSFGRESNWDQV